MVSSFINLGWGRGTQMALCFKMILINQLHNQNALVSLFFPPLPWITAEQRGWWEGMARTGGEAQLWQGNVQTAVRT